MQWESNRQANERMEYLQHDLSLFTIHYWFVE